jgi:hypothetical protein
MSSIPLVGEGRTSGNRVSVYEAAEVMGLTVDAIRKRISRDTIPHKRDEDGRVWVLLDADQDAASKVQDTDQPQSDSSALISAKDETIATLREQLEAERQAHAEARRLLLEALTKIPAAIEAPSETPQAAETVTETPEGAEDRSHAPGAHSEAEGVQRPWWRRVFGG